MHEQTVIVRKIRWLCNISKLECEPFVDGRPMEALPAMDGILAEGAICWAYRDGDLSRVRVLFKSSDNGIYTLFDVDRSYQLSGIQRNAFTFLD